MNSSVLSLYTGEKTYSFADGTLQVAYAVGCDDGQLTCKLHVVCSLTCTHLVVGRITCNIKSVTVFVVTLNFLNRMPRVVYVIHVNKVYMS